MQDNRLVVHGRARRSVAPDVATVGIVVRELDQDQRAAFERCGPRLNELAARLEALMGGDGQVTVGPLRVEPYWEELAEDEAGRNVQAASGPVAAECMPAVAARVISEAMALGVDEVHGPRYSVRDPSPFLGELLGAAVVAARRKAEHLAQAAERSLGGIVAVEEHFGDDWEDHGLRGAVAASAPADVDLHPVELTLSATVRVTFELA